MKRLNIKQEGNQNLDLSGEIQMNGQGAIDTHKTGENLICHPEPVEGDMGGLEDDISIAAEEGEE